jgi:hypothetical protein
MIPLLRRSNMRHDTTDLQGRATHRLRVSGAALGDVREIENVGSSLQKATHER